MQFLNTMLPYTMLASTLIPTAVALAHPVFDLPTINPQGIADDIGGTLLQGQDDILNPAEGSTSAVQGYTSGCVQIWCEVSLCAKDGMDSWAVASEELQHLMGRDCGGWGADPENKGQETCSDGKELYEGTFKVWRAHVGTKWWGNYGNATSDSLQSAKCTAQKKVNCKGKSGYCPVNGSKGQCTSKC